MSENDSEFSFVYFKFLSVLKLRKCVPSFKKYFPFTSYYLKKIHTGLTQLKKYSLSYSRAKCMVHFI